MFETSPYTHTHARARARTHTRTRAHTHTYVHVGVFPIHSAPDPSIRSTIGGMSFCQVYGLHQRFPIRTSSDFVLRTPNFLFLFKSYPSLNSQFEDPDRRLYELKGRRKSLTRHFLLRVPVFSESSFRVT